MADHAAGQRISIAMIVRDEADVLDECLGQFRPLAYEFCIVDTGSTDATLTIAQAHRARTAAFPWCNDFAAARNRSIELCQGDWVLVIDADERLDPADIPRLRALTAAPEVEAVQFITRNYTDNQAIGEFHEVGEGDPWARGFPGWHPSRKVRLIRNRPEYRFEGVIHEMLEYSLARLGVLLHTSDVPIHHYPLLRAPERIAQKQQLYLELGLAKVAQNPHDVKALTELGNQFAATCAYASAAQAYREALRLEPSNPQILRDLGACLVVLGQLAPAVKALELSVRLDGASPDAWRNKATAHLLLREWGPALMSIDLCFSLDPAWRDGHRFRAIALDGAGRFEEAATAAAAAVEAAPGSTMALDLYRALMNHLGRNPAARDRLQALRRAKGPNTALDAAIQALEPD